MVFKPGQSGNPGGRPKSDSEFLKLVREAAPNALKRMQEIASDKKHFDNFNAVKWILERAHGKPSQSLEVSGDGGGPLVAVIREK